MSYANSIKEIELQGYTIFPKALSEEDVDTLRNGLHAVACLKAVDYSENQRGHQNIHWVCDTKTLSIIIWEPMIQFLTELFGDEIICTNTLYARSSPGSEWNQHRQGWGE